MRFFEKEKGFVAYLTAGDKGMDFSEQAFLALVEGGVNCLEIGVPFSDPVADGPVIQRAMKRALEQRVTLKDVLQLVRHLRKHTDVPIVLFSYFNPVLAAGETFSKEARDSGVNALLIVDMPPDIDFFATKNLKVDIPLITLVAPSTHLQRIEDLCRDGEGFVYYVCRKGTTGMKEGLPDDFDRKIREIKGKTSLPVVAGFGIASKEMARETLRIADGFVVGSYFVNAIEKGCSPETLKQMAQQLDPRR